MSRPRKKTLIPLLILTLISLGILGGLGYFVEPNTIKDVLIPGGYLPFFGLVFLTVFFTGTLVTSNTRRGLFLAVGITGFLVLRLIKLGNIVNGLLLLALLIVIDFYFASR